MRINVRMFAAVKDLTGKGKFYIESDSPLSCRDALRDIAALYPASSDLLKECAVAKNGSFTDASTLLSEGDELAILPPVSGG